MIKHYYECDRCGKRLETRKEQTPFGEIEVVCDIAKTKFWNTTSIFQHLCKECALEIDNAMLMAKFEYLHNINEALKGVE